MSILYPKTLINLGSAPDAGDGDSARRGGAKINQLFLDVYSQLGDRPLVTDQLDTNYGSKKVLAPGEVGDIMPAGKWFYIQGMNPGIRRSVDGSDGNWFFLSRGEQVILDLTNMDPFSVFNVVLPLAAKGDVVKIRDSFGTWGGVNNKKVAVWTTPYEFMGAPSEDPDYQWKFGDNWYNEPGRLPSEGHASIKGRNCSYKQVSLFTNTQIPVGVPEYFNTTYIDIEFIYTGDTYGWVYYSRSSLDSIYQAGALIFNTPYFSAKSRIFLGDFEHIWYDPSVFGFEERSGVVYGSNPAVNSFIIDYTNMQLTPNGFILKNSSDGEQYRTNDRFYFYLDYPKDSIEYKVYSGYSFEIINDSSCEIVIGPLIYKPDGTQNSSKYDFVSIDPRDYDWVDGCLNVDGLLSDQTRVIPPTVERIRFTFVDDIFQPDGKTTGWRVTIISEKQEASFVKRMFMITDTSQGIDPVLPDVPEDDAVWTKIDISEYGIIDADQGDLRIMNIITGLPGVDPFYENEDLRFKYIKTQVFVNGVLLASGDNITADWYPFISSSVTDMLNASPDNWASIPPNERPLSAFNALHFIEGMRAGDIVTVVWQKEASLDDSIRATIEDIVKRFTFNTTEDQALLREQLSINKEVGSRLNSYSENISFVSLRQGGTLIDDFITFSDTNQFRVWMNAAGELVQGNDPGRYIGGPFVTLANYQQLFYEVFTEAMDAGTF